VVEIPSGALNASSDGKTTTLEMRDVPIIDQPRWPAYDTPTYPAQLTFRLVFKALAQLEATVEVPALGFSWRSDPLETSSANFAAIGQEVNGRYYSP
jgi:hypothetical protein